ncbi:MAG: oxidative damage protection protein, partial [Pseudomonadales bacterium]
APPFPGSKGQEIFESVSQTAWDEWQTHQTMLINEKHLNMMDKAARKYLTDQRDLFFEGGQVDHAEGYLAPEASED